MTIKHNMSSIMKDIIKEFSNRLKEERKSKGWTQEQAAKNLGIVQSTYCRYEKGGTAQGNQPDLIMLCKIAELFEVSTDYLLGLED